MGLTSCFGRVPAENAVNLPSTSARSSASAKDRPTGVAQTDEEQVEHGLIVPDIGSAPDKGSKKIGASATNIKCKIADELFGNLQIYRMEKRAALSRDADQARGRQLRQVMRKRVLLHAEYRSHFSQAHTLRYKAHEETEYLQATRMAKRRKGESCAFRLQHRITSNYLGESHEVFMTQMAAG